MIQSLQNFDPSACVFVLALDKYTENLIYKLKQKNIRLITLDQIEDDNVLNAKGNRGLVEYYWTLSSVLTAYVYAEYNSEFDTLTYLDSDIFFYSDPTSIFSQVKQDTSCIITPHNFSKRLEDRIVNGKFCVQWVTFINNETGRKILYDWRADCLEWCYYKLENGKMGDQKYLDYWPDRYEGVVIDQNIGAGVAPWNYEDFIFSKVGNNIFVNDQIVIFYHFHQFTQIGPTSFDRLSEFYTSHCIEPDTIYATYEKKCAENYTFITNFIGVPPVKFSNAVRLKHRIRRFVQKYFPHKVKEIIRRIVRF